ncbi:MAG: hypothetical protein L3J12_05005, partial [Spirochaetales bacterium]|nr:hypothetical protein [Spirochaetales bacterium]
GISLIGLVVMYTTGFLFLHALPAVKHLNLRERLFFAPTFFFAYILVIFFANWATQGRLLSSSPLLWIFFTASLVALLWSGRHQVANTLFFLHQKRREGGWREVACQVFFPGQTIYGGYRLIHRYRFLLFCLIIFAATLISCVPVLIGERFDVDALDHLMWTNQFLNGKVFSSLIPYAEIDLSKAMYPFIVHVAAAFFARLFLVQAETGIIITTVIQALLYPLGLYFLVLKITNNYRIALLAVITGCFYFGHGYLLGLWWFNIPIQRLDMANNVCRMMSMAIAPFILYLFLLITDDENKKIWVLAGILTGIAGLIHPYFFSYVITFSFVAILYFSIQKDWVTIGKLSGILLISLPLFSLILMPSILPPIDNAPASGQFTVIPQEFKDGSLSQVIITPYEYLLSYGLIGILAIFSLFIWQRGQYKNFIQLLSFTILLLLAATWAKEILFVRFNIPVPYNPAQHKYGNTLFLVCIILSSIFIRNFRIKNRWGQTILGSLVIVLTLSTLPNLKAFERYFIQRDPFFSQYRAPDNIYRLIKSRLQPDDVLAIPNWWANRFASFTGYDILYINENNYYTPYRQLANILLFLPAGKKQSAIAEEAGMQYEELLQQLVGYFGIEAVIVPQRLSNTYNQYKFTHYLESGSTHLPARKKIPFAIYKVDKNKISSENNIRISERILTNKKIFQIAAGGIPLITERYIRLVIYNQRRKNFISLASTNNNILGVNSSDHDVYEIDPDNGRITQRINLPEQPSAIAVFKNELYIYFRKDKTLRKVNLKRKSNLQDIGILAAPVGKVENIAFDKEGKLWFFAWSSRQKQYFLYSYNLSTQQTVTEGKLPRKQIYTGLAFEEIGGTMLISTKRGYYMRWSPEEKKIISRYYNGRIRPSGICTIASTLYAYNGLNHLIGKLEPLEL